MVNDGQIGRKLPQIVSPIFFIDARRARNAEQQC
jgi:hypothetical protein